MNLWPACKVMEGTHGLLASRVPQTKRLQGIPNQDVMRRAAGSVFWATLSKPSGALFLGRPARGGKRAHV